jgi:hypothetical protein
MSAPPFAPLADLLAGWSADVLQGKPPPRWPSGAGPLARFPLAPGLVCLIGGPPGSGKTALANQLVIDAARLTPDLRALVTCCEVPPAVLLDRTLARLGVRQRLHHRLHQLCSTRVNRGHRLAWWAYRTTRRARAAGPRKRLVLSTKKPR